MPLLEFPIPAFISLHVFVDSQVHLPSRTVEKKHARDLLKSLSYSAQLLSSATRPSNSISTSTVVTTTSTNAEGVRLQDRLAEGRCYFQG